MMTREAMCLRLNTELKDRLRERAWQERSSVTQTIARAIEVYLKKPVKKQETEASR